MPEEKYLIAALLLMMAITYMTRATPLLLRLDATPAWFNDLLQYLPVAIIASITVPALLISREGTPRGLDADLLAALVVLIVAWRSKNLIISVGSGLLAHIVISLYL